MSDRETGGGDGAIRVLIRVGRNKQTDRSKIGKDAFLTMVIMATKKTFLFAVSGREAQRRKRAWSGG